MDRSPGVVEHMDVRERPGCAVQSGDKPAAIHFVFLINPQLLSHVIEFMKKSITNQRNWCNMRVRLC